MHCLCTKCAMSVHINRFLASPMHRRVPAWWKEAGVSGTKQLYQPEKPVVYVPITSILGRQPLIPARDHGTIPAALRGSKQELFPLGKCDEDGRPGTGSRLLHQLVGHVLAHRPPQEASDRLSRVCTKSAKSASDTLCAHFVLSKWYTNAYFLQIYAIRHAHLIHILCRLCQYFVHTLCRL
jgi:hypothetical protein